jgi:hypothetical protein
MNITLIRIQVIYMAKLFFLIKMENRFSVLVLYCSICYSLNNFEYRYYKRLFI